MSQSCWMCGQDIDTIAVHWPRCPMIESGNAEIVTNGILLSIMEMTENAPERP